MRNEQQIVTTLAAIHAQLDRITQLMELLVQAHRKEIAANEPPSIFRKMRPNDDGTIDVWS